MNAYIRVRFLEEKIHVILSAHPPAIERQNVSVARNEEHASKRVQRTGGGYTLKAANLMVASAGRADGNEASIDH